MGFYWSTTDSNHTYYHSMLLVHNAFLLPITVGTGCSSLKMASYWSTIGSNSTTTAHYWFTNCSPYPTRNRLFKSEDGILLVHGWEWQYYHSLLLVLICAFYPIRNRLFKSKDGILLVHDWERQHYHSLLSLGKNLSIKTFSLNICI